MFLNLCPELVSHSKGVVLLDAELCDHDRRARVNLLRQILNVGHSVFKVCLQTSLFDKGCKLVHRVFQVIDIGCQMLIILL
mgnify:CR=1 FL=1